jgi:hypothetical protein
VADVDDHDAALAVLNVVAKHWLSAAVFPLLVIGLVPAQIGLVWASISFMVSIMNVIQMKYTFSVIPYEVLGRAGPAVSAWRGIAFKADRFGQTGITAVPRETDP